MQDDAQDLFRRAWRRFPATVSIITLHDGRRPRGMTATAICPVAAEPASLLACVNQSASMHESLSRADQFCVNVLHRDQEGIARIFADQFRRDERFTQGGWVNEPGAPPYLPTAQAVLVCDLDQLVSVGTHSICIGFVRKIQMRDDIDPLIYLDGQFISATPQPPVGGA